MKQQRLRMMMVLVCAAGAVRAAGDSAHEPTAPDGVLVLSQARELALGRNPELLAMASAARAAEARIGQARAYPNPVLGLEIGEYDRDGQGFDSAETTLVVGQSLELGGKRRGRTRAAEAGSALAGWEWEGARREVAASVAHRFVAVVAAQRQLELAQSTVALAEQTRQAVVERVKAGKEPPLQASKADAALAMAALAVEEAEAALMLSRNRLAALWGDDEARFARVEGDLDETLAILPPLASFQARLATHPRLGEWDAHRRSAEALLASEKAAGIPDLEATVGFQRFEEDGTDALTLGIAVPLPLFDRNRGNIAAAEHTLSAVEGRGRAAASALAAELSATHATWTAAHRRVEILRTRVVPAMEEAYAAAHEGYRQGKFGFLDMLDAQRGLIDAQGALVHALAAYHTAAADIERLAGEPDPAGNRSAE